MAKVDDVLDNALGGELVPCRALGRYHMHEGAPRATAIHHDHRHRVTSLLLVKVLELDQALLGERCVIHMDHGNSTVARTILVKVRPLSGEHLDALIAPTPIRQVVDFVLSDF